MHTRRTAFLPPHTVAHDGVCSLANQPLFVDPKTLRLPVGAVGSPDGLKVDHLGNIFATGPGGVHVFTPTGTHLGTIATGAAMNVVAWCPTSVVALPALSLSLSLDCHQYQVHWYPVANHPHHTLHPFCR